MGGRLARGRDAMAVVEGGVTARGAAAQIVFVGWCVHRISVLHFGFS
jgi:hypothetical protein